MKTLPLSLALLATPAAAADQFDLVCRGSEADPRGIEKTYGARFRVDLSAMKYCEDVCSERTKIAKVNENYIIFSDLNDPALGRVYMSVDRRTGELDGEASVGPARFVTKATCERREFSGFPKVVRRF